MSANHCKIKTHPHLLSICTSLLVLIAILRFEVVAGVSSQPLSCQDENGKPVDWYIAYKFPVMSHHDAPFNTGYAYSYITSAEVEGSNFRQQPAHSDLGPMNFLKKLKGLLLKYTGAWFGFGKQPRAAEPAPHDSLTTRPVPGASEQHRQKKLDKSQWTVSEKLITEPDSLVMQTLAPAFGDHPKSSPLNSVFYNDQPPHSEGRVQRSSARAHAKGALLIDESSRTGVWLSHSVPHFPPQRDETLEFQSNARINGQTFMCLSFDLSRSGSQIVNHLVNMYPLVYDSLVSNTLFEILPELRELKLSGDSRRRNSGLQTRENLRQDITTSGGQHLQIYSKSSDFGRDMYSDWMEDDLGSSLLVQSWRSGAGTPLNSSCPRNHYHVNNVENMKLFAGLAQLSWSYRQDHSKWTISESVDKAIVCISDINRMESQFERGGGAICIRCPSCWEVFMQTILEVEPCPVPRTSTGRLIDTKSSDLK